MSDWLSCIFERGPLATAAKVAAFAEARQAVLADNIANIDTPGYKVRDLPVAEFQQALARAIEQTRVGGAPLAMASTRHIRIEPDGRLTFQPIDRDDANLLYHDRGNRSIEQEMGEMVKNALVHRVATEVLRKQQETLEAAIREKF